MEYVTRVSLEVNGQNIADFQAITEGEVQVAKAINLMHHTGFGMLTRRYTVTCDYVVPADNAEVDFAGVRNGTLTIDKENGRRVVYSGVYCLTIGETKYDGENEATRTITFGAANKVG